MADFMHAPDPIRASPRADHAGDAPGAVLLRVLEAAQRMVAYCDNGSVGGADDPELALLGLSTPSLDRALRDLRGSVRAMNQAMTTDDGLDLLAVLNGAGVARLVA